MKYEIVETHSYWKEKRISRLQEFFMTVKAIGKEEAVLQADFINWYKKEYSALCFEAIAYDGDRVVGYMRCYNDPKKVQRWFVGDINVVLEYQQKHIASKLYEMIIDEVESYEKAEYIEASINKANIKSIGLHRKFDFRNTRRQKEFAGFYFDPEETFYKKILYRYLAFPDSNEAKAKFKELFDECPERSCLVKGLLAEDIFQKAMEGMGIKLFSIWRGEKLAGFYIEDDEDYFEYKKY